MPRQGADGRGGSSLSHEASGGRASRRAPGTRRGEALWSLFRWLVGLAAVCALGGAAVAAEPARMHPLNVELDRLYPRGFDMPFPDIPRITAGQALELYRADQAIFFHVGESGPDIIGCMRISEKEAKFIDVAKLKKMAKGKAVVAYCY